MPQGLKQLCIEHGIPLMCRFGYAKPDEPVFGTHTLYLDRDRVTVTSRDGKHFNVFGVGFSEEDAFVDLVVSLNACMESRGVTPPQNLVLTGRSVYGGMFQAELEPGLTV